MAFHGCPLRRLFGMTLLILSLMLAAGSPKDYAGAANAGHFFSNATIDLHPEMPAHDDDSCCHVGDFCLGAVATLSRPTAVPELHQVSVTLTFHAYSFSSAALGFDPPPPRIS